jgi:hypothetical protein
MSENCDKCNKTLTGRELITAFSCRTCGKMFCGSCAGYGGGMVARLSCPYCDTAGKGRQSESPRRKWWQFWR